MTTNKLTLLAQLIELMKNNQITELSVGDIHVVRPLVSKVNNVAPKANLTLDQQATARDLHDEELILWSTGYAPASSKDS